MVRFMHSFQASESQPMPDRHSLILIEADVVRAPRSGRCIAIKFADKQFDGMNAGWLVGRRHRNEMRTRHVRLFQRDPRLQRMSNLMTMDAVLGAVE